MRSVTYCLPFAFILLILATAPVQAVEIELTGSSTRLLEYEQVWDVTLKNPSKETRIIYLRNEVSKVREGPVFKATTKPFPLFPGEKKISLSDVKLIDVWFKDGYKKYFQPGARLPEGKYTINVFVRENLNTASRSVRVKSGKERTGLKKKSPPGIPAEQSRPVFRWNVAEKEHLFPVTYDLKIVALKEGQTKEDAMTVNRSHFEMKGLNNTSFRYPESASPFDPELKYAWQVTAVMEGIPSGESKVFLLDFETAMINCSAFGEDRIWCGSEGKCIREEDGTWLWLGFHHEWEDTPHRLDDLASYYYHENSEIYDIRYEPDYADGTAELSGALFERQNVGVWPDDLNFWTYKKGIKTGVAEFRYGEVEKTIEMDVDERFTETFEIVTVLPSALQEYDNVTLFLRGFSFEEQASGKYPTRGFGLKVGDIHRSGNNLYWELEVLMHPAPSPINPNPTPDPATYKVRCLYTLIGGNEDEVTFTHGSKNWDGPHFDGTAWASPERAPEATRMTSITGQGKQAYNHAVVVWRGFYITINRSADGLNNTESSKRGRIVREIDVRLKTNINYNWSTGKATFYPDIYFSNRSAAPLAMNTDYKAYFTLVQFNDDQWEATNVLREAGWGASEGSVGAFFSYEYFGPMESHTFQVP